MTAETKGHAEPAEPEHAVSLVIGAQGGIGSAMAAALEERGESVWRLSRHGDPPMDITQPESIIDAVSVIAKRLAQEACTLRRVIIATGVLQGATPEGLAMTPERSLKQLRAETLMHQFRINAVGPALLLQHVLPLLPRQQTSWVACLSARVGSIGDNRLGGWYGYRASKAALNQLVHTAAIELSRTHPLACCVVLHPGTVDTPLSRPFSKTGLEVRDASVAAAELIGVMDALTPADTGEFFDHKGLRIVW
jgi:NAD(P)-dependent dehydrogenase (short-subunit alcohol dehydrogenase family)